MSFQTAPALEISLTCATTGQAGDIPAGDANGTQLMALARAAADYREDIIEDAHTLNLTICYDNGITAGLIGQWAIGTQSNGRPDSGTIGIRGATEWYDDPTPASHSEYNMTQTLFRNAAPARAAVFAQSAAGTLAVEIFGAPGSPNYDHFTITGTAAPGGRLEVIFHVPGALPCDTWRIFNAGAITGNFIRVVTAGVPAGHELLVLQDAGGVYLKFVRHMKFADCAQEAVLAPPNDKADSDPDNDGLSNGLEMFPGGNPLQTEPELLPAGSVVKAGNGHFPAITVPVGLDTTPSD